jgi:hypothetical protein
MIERAVPDVKGDLRPHAMRVRDRHGSERDA